MVVGGESGGLDKSVEGLFVTRFSIGDQSLEGIPDVIEFGGRGEGEGVEDKGSESDEKGRMTKTGEMFDGGEQAE